MSTDLVAGRFTDYFAGHLIKEKKEKEIERKGKERRGEGLVNISSNAHQALDSCPQQSQLVGNVAFLIADCTKFSRPPTRADS